MNTPEVIHEGADFVVLAKPAGMVVHHDAQHTSGTVVDWLLEHYPDARGVGENAERPGIVHRLDQDTSGVLLVARTQAMHQYLKKLFQTGGVTKVYQALVVGNVKNDAGIINAPIARSTKNFARRVVGGKQGRSREAITEYKVRERLSAEEGDFTLLDVFPKTGRTHQIRSHFAHLGYPIVCDMLYGGKRYVCPAELGRQFLHAFSLEYVAPNGTRAYFEAPLPEDLVRCLKGLHGKK